MSAKDFLNNMDDSEIAIMLRNLKMQQAETEAAKGKTNEEIIQIYMDRRAAQDEEIAAIYPNNPQGKTIKDCYEYVFDLARKGAHGQQMACLTSMQVFNIAEQYFLDSTITKFEKAKPTPRPATKPAGKPADPTADLRAKIATQEAKAKAWEDKHQADMAAWAKKYANDLFLTPEDNPHLKEVNPYLDELTALEQQLQEMQETNPIQNINGDTVNTDTGEVLPEDEKLPEEEIEEDLTEEIEIEEE